MVHKGHAAAEVTQIWVVHTITMVPKLQLRDMSGSLALQQPGSGMTFMASVATEDYGCSDHVGVQGPC